MRIVILGAGQVGSSVAENLASEDNDITVIDTDRDSLAALQDRLDIRTIQGTASHPEVLTHAGIEQADMLLAVTNSDEVNMLACQIAHTLFHVPTKIARVRAREYMDANHQLFGPEAIPVDMVISPEQVVTDYIRRLIETPGALQVLEFAQGRVRLVAVRAYYGGALVGQQVRELREHIPDINTRIAAIFRRGRPILPKGDTVIEVDDEVHIIAAREHISEVMNELRRRERPYRRVIIVGGGNIGERLAGALEDRYQVKLIDHNSDTTRMLSEKLSKTIVLQGDAASEDLLLEEGIEEADIFVAVTSSDEANILSSMLAKRLGARKVMALINRPAYARLIENNESIDIAVSPQQATISALLAHVRRGDVVVAHSLRKGAAEALEAVAHGDSKTSRVVGRTIGDIKLPSGCTIGAIVRGKEVLIAHHDTVIEAEDHIILFLTEKHRMRDVEKLFQLRSSLF